MAWPVKPDLSSQALAWLLALLFASGAYMAQWPLAMVVDSRVRAGGGWPLLVSKYVAELLLWAWAFVGINVCEDVALKEGRKG